MDTAQHITNRLLSQLEHNLNQLYNEAQQEILDEIDLDELYLGSEEAGPVQRLKLAEKHGLDDTVKIITGILIAKNIIASNRINSAAKRVYIVNYSYNAQDIKQRTGVEIAGSVAAKIGTYTRRAYREQQSRRFVSSRVLKSIKQGIRKGEGYDKLIRRVQQIINVDRNRARTIARTEGRRMRNGSRYDALKEGQSMGMIFVKIWRHSPRTKTQPRHWHIDMDGEERDLDEAFSNGLMYPCEAGAPAEEVCNCECYLDEEFKGWR